MKKKILFIIICLLLILLILIGIKFFFLKSHLILNGDKIIILKLDDEYRELGIKDESNVKITGSVDTKRVGEYKITYELNGKKTIRTVKVIDDIKPVITLNGNTDIYLYLGNEYDDDGVSAVDNYDGDITKNVVKNTNLDINKLGDYKIEYEVMDSSNNKSIVTRNIHIIEKKDSEIRSIPILMYHFFYDSSNGETGSDSNWIDIKKFEEQIKYLVDNDYYFPTWKEIELYLDSKIKLPDKSIVITADDGDPSFFNLGVKVLEKYNVRATSFMITNWYSPANYQYDKNLITIESHSHDMHKGGCATGYKGLFQCIDKEKGLEDLRTSISITGSSNVFCYPFGDVNDREKDMLREAGFHLAVTTQSGKIKPGMDKLALPRVRVSGNSSLQFFIKSIN